MVTYAESKCIQILSKVFFSVLVGATTAGQAAPYIEIFSMARGAAAVIFATIDATPDIDVEAEGGEDPGRGCGQIEFKDVHFSYPSRKGVQVTYQWIWLDLPRVYVSIEGSKRPLDEDKRGRDRGPGRAVRKRQVQRGSAHPEVLRRRQRVDSHRRQGHKRHQRGEIKGQVSLIFPIN